MLQYPLLLSGVAGELIPCPALHVCPFQISLETKDVLIECTATDLTKAKVVLNTVACMFSQYCKVPYEVEPVEVIDSFGESHGKLSKS